MCGWWGNGPSDRSSRFARRSFRARDITRTHSFYPIRYNGPCEEKPPPEQMVGLRLRLVVVAGVYDGGLVAEG